MSLRSARNQLWSEVKNISGVVTVGIGKKNGKVALVIFMDKNRLNSEDLPEVFGDIPIILESTDQAIAYGGIQ